MKAVHELLSASQFYETLKRSFDLIVSSIGLLVFGWIILLAYIVATIDTKQDGFFTQHRVGQHGILFKVIKIRTMRNVIGIDTTVTTSKDSRITHIGRLFRRTKIDELPQLINVFRGQMSFVGPRPEVPEVVATYSKDMLRILDVRPGITSIATLALRNEEELLTQYDNPDEAYLSIFVPYKVNLSMEHARRRNLWFDFSIMLKTLWQLSFGRIFLSQSSADPVASDFQNRAEVKENNL